MKSLDGNKEVELKDVTPVIRQPEQDNVKDNVIQGYKNHVVYVSMQHLYPPIKVFDLFEFESNHFGQVYTPYDSFEKIEDLYINNRYRDVVLLRFNDLIDALRTKYFRISEDLFSLFGPDYEDETSLRNYGVKASRRTFIYLLREALEEYSNCDGKVLYTRFSWLKSEGSSYETNHSSGRNLMKYKFIPNWVDWMRGVSDITEERVILPFRLILDQQLYNFLGNNQRFAQNYAAQTFYSYYAGDALCSYVSEYPFIYSIDSTGNFTDASAIFELNDPFLFELIFARVIARYIKRNLDIIQLPGNVVSFNLDNLLQELSERIDPKVEDAFAAYIAGQWNAMNNTK